MCRNLAMCGSPRMGVAAREQVPPPTWFPQHPIQWLNTTQAHHSLEVTRSSE